MKGKTLAIIDLGTNTFHLLIARIDEREDFSIEEKFKEPVKLGEGGINSGRISEAAFKRGIRALKKFRKLISSKKADEVRAFATSAIRSATNGPDFVQAAKEEAGIDIRIINGNEEAALIFEGVKNGVQLPYVQDTLLVDIGGGSVEFIVCRDGAPMLLRSLNIGAARMLEHIDPSDPITPSEMKKTEEFIRERIDGLLAELKEFNLTFLVGSSGSFETLGAMIAVAKGDILSSVKLNSYRFTPSKFRSIHKKLASSSRRQRLDIPGMDSMRVDMIVMASILINLILKELPIKELMVSVYALKEGILYRYIAEQKERLNKIVGNTSRSLRAKSIKNLAEKFDFAEAHSLKVSEIACSIYDQLGALHPFGHEERELLGYAALLHDIGYFINRSGHHKHGQYIIMHSGLSGFSHDEIVILGNIVRYHRKSLPTRDHFHYKILEQRQRFCVRVLAGILRIADHLDRGGRGMVKSVKVVSDKQSIRIQVDAKEPVDIEIQSAMSERSLMEQVFSRDVIIGQV